MSKKNKITINEIASLANTSKTTVSFYLNGKFDRMGEETKNRIAKVIEETGYQPSAVARSLNSKSMKLIGVIIGDITNTFANQIVKGIDEIAREKNYQLIVGNSNYDFEQEANYVDRMLAMGVDGFIIQPTIQFNGLIDKIKAQNKKIVFIDSQTSMEDNAWVKTNNYEAVLNVTTQLIDKGYEDYILITADPSVLSTRQERTNGFIHALELQDIPYKQHIVENDVSSEELSDVFEEIIDTSKNTLVFAANCWLLPLVYVGLKDSDHLQSDDIGLVGFDNTEWTVLSSPTVTTIVQPAMEEGRVAAKILIDHIEDLHNEAPQQILPCTVNYMDSTI